MDFKFTIDNDNNYFYVSSIYNFNEINLKRLIIDCHKGMILYGVTHDSGNNPFNSGIKITTALDFPFDQFDEYYILSKKTEIYEIEKFVNIGGFVVINPEHLILHPTWGKNTCDWLIPIQERLKETINNLDAITYLAIGDYLNIISSNSKFIKNIKVFFSN